MGEIRKVIGENIKKICSLKGIHKAMNEDIDTIIEPLRLQIIEDHLFAYGVRS